MSFDEGGWWVLGGLTAVTALGLLYQLLQRRAGRRRQAHLVDSESTTMMPGQ